MKNGYTELPPGKIANVVTCLEMLAEPQQLRPERADGALTVARWERPALDEYRTLFRRVGAPYLWFSRLELDDEALAQTIYDPDCEIYVARDRAAVVGWFELDFQADQCELRFFGLVAEAIGTGAGRWLMNRVLERAWARPIRRFWLHTCNLDHPGAMNFDCRSGFAPFKREIEIHEDPRLNGLLPRDVAPDVPIL